MQADLLKRSQNKCELCTSESSLGVLNISQNDNENLEEVIVICKNCQEQLDGNKEMDTHHWRCLNDSMWSEHIPVQIMAYRALSLLPNEAWAIDLKSQMYLDEESLAKANTGLPDSSGDNGKAHLDSNGTKLAEGDNVTLIKDLVVKGANFTAKRGTMVRSITLSDNPEHIEGKVNGTRIVLITKFLKKVNE